MKRIGYAHILFVDVDEQQQVKLEHLMYEGCGFLDTTVSIDFTQKNNHLATIGEVRYLIIQEDELSIMNHKLLSLLPYVRNAKLILLCDNEENFFSLQTYDWFFVLRKTHLLMDSQLFVTKLKHIYQNQECYYFKQASDLTKIRIQDIYYIESNKNYIFIYGKNFCWKDRTTLKYAYSIVSFYGFLYINRGVLVNQNHIKNIRDNFVELDNHRKLYISRAKVNNIIAICKSDKTLAKINEM